MFYNLPMMGHVNLLEAIPGVPWLSEKYIRVWHALVPRYVLNRPNAPIYGLYEVGVMIQSPAVFTVRMMDDSSHFYSTEYNQAKRSVTISGDPDKSKKNAFTYSRPDSDHVVLEGTLISDPLVVKLKRIDPSKFLLVNRGFHWIDERPFNR